MNPVSVAAADAAATTKAAATPTLDPLLPLQNLSALGHRVAAIRRFLSTSIDLNATIPDHHLASISHHLSAAAQQIILNGAALLASAQPLLPSNSNPKSTDHRPPEASDPPPPLPDNDEDDDNCEIVEIDEAELMAEHVHFCEICGKGFKRDANLRMHMRAHGNQYKTLEALTKPERDRTVVVGSGVAGKVVKFSCPFVGCNRNRGHVKFRPMKSVVCLRNHFKRSHCPKMYSCYRCNKKNFSVLADLRNHVKNCGESKWRCSCGTTFSRKDKLFGHIALFEGHMPAIGGSEEEGSKKGVASRKEVDGKGKGPEIGESELNVDGFSPRFFKELVEEFDEIEHSSWMST